VRYLGVAETCICGKEAAGIIGENDKGSDSHLVFYCWSRLLCT